MNCPNCKSDNTSVVDTRSRKTYMYRRRKCEDCKEKFTTWELIVSKKWEEFFKLTQKD